MRNFDAIVVGSSPICIMKAIQLKKMGEHVAIIDKEDGVGGAWKTGKAENIGTIERACHMIEFYSEGYENISSLLDIEFEVMRPQPIRVYQNGKKRKYLTRYRILKVFLSQLFAYLVLICIRSLNKLIPDKLKIRKGEKLSLSDLRKNIVLLFFKRVLSLLGSVRIKQPKGGYSIIPKKIIECLNKYDIPRDIGYVKTVSITDNRCVIKLENRSIYANKVYLSESTDIEILPLLGSDSILRRLSHENFHIVVEVGQIESKEIPGYISIENDENFHRISKYPLSLDESYSYSIFLVQIKKHPNQFKDLIHSIQNIFFVSGIVKNMNITVSVVKLFQDTHCNLSQDAKYASGIYLGGKIEILQSIGDLGRIASTFLDKRTKK